MKTKLQKHIVDHPVLHIPAFTFVEGDSVVECRRCRLEEHYPKEQQ